ncbi:endoplasmic oxidoreductin [Microstroma glucosiphilum]|uniref:Endoplasmic oxidoreductin n=1 Tax=Pseudomicrostroma glucosiphilum TaxID=1684307 RepID=A0A316U7M4_9BASI|nr:endoplasmic oxidoreductin [Pseudomicrostroma glucosiphilum]PWN21240.1 endoplasmic oxidoreductin [Pseudomicrostroma glucosiphilum]
MRSRTTWSRKIQAWAILTASAVTLALLIGTGSYSSLAVAATSPSARRPNVQFPMLSDPSRGTLLEDVLSAPLSSSGDDICRPTGQIHDACCDYETVEKRLNTPKFYQTLRELVETNYFRYYKVDLYRDCPFWSENGLCMNQACGVEKASEDEIPEEFRSSQLSSVAAADRSEVIFQDDQKKTSGRDTSADPYAPPDSCVCRETDFCHWEAEEFSPESTWVDLIKNPERFTGYAGPGANRVWKAIYEENCFGAVPKGSFLEPPRAKSSGGGTGFVDKSSLTGSSKGGAAFGFSPPGLSNLMPSLQAPSDPAANEQCLEKRVFYRVISGLHASISTHICSDYLDQKSGEWSPNLECFVSRIAQHPERLQNVYFNYVLLVRALARAGEYLTSFRLKKGHAIPVSEQRTLTLLESLVSQANQCPPTFDEASMFQASNPEAPMLKQQFRDSFRNISSIMDCVGCDKCRLWGKMQVNGLGTAMKILFSFDDEDLVDVEKNPAPLLERSELVALINTLHRFAESLNAVETFRQMYQRELKGESLATHGDGSKSEAHDDTQSQHKATNSPVGPLQTAAEVESEVPDTLPSDTQDDWKARVVPNGSQETPAKTIKEEARRSSRDTAGSLTLLAKEWVQHFVRSTSRTLDACRSSLVRCVDWLYSPEESVTRSGHGQGLEESRRGNLDGPKAEL